MIRYPTILVATLGLCLQVGGSPLTNGGNSGDDVTHKSVTSARVESNLRNYFTNIVNAIYVVEGGSRTKYPYGIKSIKTTDPRRTCYNTVRNNYYRWQSSGKKETFISFLGDRYCPAASDSVGNKRWKDNMRRIVGQQP